MSDIDIPSDWIGDDPATFYHALGCLFHAFARSEASLSLAVTNFVTGTVTTFLAQHEAEQEMDRLRQSVRAVAQGGRYADRKDAINRLIRVAGAASFIVDAVKYVFDQFSEIQSLRDNLAHYPAINISPGLWRVSTFTSSFELHSVKRRVFTIDALENAALDLSTIDLHLTTLLQLASAGDVHGDFGELRQSWPPPWRYKPSAQAPLHLAPNSNPQ